MIKNTGKGKKSAVESKLSARHLCEVAGFALPRHPRMSDMVGIRLILLLCAAQTPVVPPFDAPLPDINTLHRITFLRMLLQPHHDSSIHWPSAKLQMQPVSSFYGIFRVSTLHLHYPAAPAPNPFTSLSAISLKYASVGLRSGA